MYKEQILPVDSLPGDSEDYRLLHDGVKLSANVRGFTCELGVRRGGGSGVIMRAIKQYSPHKIHIAVDPYGHIEYEHKEGEVVRLDYTNKMKTECLKNLYAYSDLIDVPVLFFNVEDTEFFNRYPDGIPIYDNVKMVQKEYSMVHYDAAHAHLPLLTEINFFKEKTPPGGCWVFDDITNFYDHDAIEEHVLSLDFVLIEKTKRKALYQKIGKFENKN